MQKLNFTSLRGHQYLSLFYRLCFVLLLSSIFRLIFWYFHKNFFQEYSLVQSLDILKEGLRFDIVSVLYLNIIYILFVFFIDKWAENLLMFIYILPNILGFFMASIDIAYFPFTLRRTSWQSLLELKSINNGGLLAKSFLNDYAWVLILFGISVFLLIYFSRKTKPTVFIKNIHFKIDSLFFSSFILLAGLRGGSLAHAWRPIGLNHGGSLVKSPQDQVLMTNTPFTIFKTINAIKLKEDAYFTDTAILNSIYSPWHNTDQKQDNEIKTSRNKYNVVILIVESLSEEATVRGPVSYTPFLDNIRSKSQKYAYSFANGKRSIEALPSILAGIPSLDMTYPLSEYAGNKIDALPNLLKSEGYSSAFFHGAPNGSMGFDGFCKTAGFDQYYGKNEYGNDTDFDGVWGIWDEPFLNFTADKINTLKTPFLATIFTLSSHDPFKVPEKYKDKFKKGEHPIYETLGYTDFVLERFFEKAKKQSWYKNTIFVITGDHTSSHANPGVFSNNMGRYRVPILFYLPEKSMDFGAEKSVNIQQIDIGPSILAILGYQKPFFSFGKNIFEQKQLNFGIQKLGDGYQWTENNYLLLFKNEKSEALYNFASDSLLKQNLLANEPMRVRNMERNLKAFLQQYHHTVINNKTHLQ